VTTPTPVPTVQPDQPVTIAFGGDVHFEGASVQALHGGMSAIAPVLKSADLAMVNLETAITERGTPENKTYRFRAPATAYAALRDAGVDVVTQANNHGVDYGPVGLSDTLAAIKATHFPAVGIGANETEAYKPWRTTIKGQRIAVIGATQVIDSNLRASWTAGPDHPGLASAFRVSTLLASVRAARRTADIVIVYLHWGTEYQGCPNGQQFALAPQLVAAGADVIVGSHAHEQLGAGWRGHAYIDYGLGNFVFYAHGRPVATRSGVLMLTARRHAVTKATWLPAEIESGVPVPVKGNDAIAARQQLWAELRPCTHLSSKPD
jgi:poly-gamma-glutamate capsule biosynthesis protein CapA/YwtB (metallophosphatase superfamily)